MEARSCPHCGAMVPPSVTLVPHGGGACPLKLAEHEKRMQLLDDDVAARQSGRWEVAISADDERQDELLDDGWEPFAAFLNVGYQIAFRRRRPVE